MKKLGTLFAVSLALALNVGSVSAADYVIDTGGGHASVGFRFKHLGIAWLTGYFEKFEGTFSYDPNNIAATKISVDLDTTSLNSNHAERDRHIRSSDYLDTAKFPQAKFVSTRVESKGNGKATVYGNLTLHGVTKEIAIDATMTGEGSDPWGGYRTGFEGTTTLNTQDFGMSFPPSNQVELMLAIEGIRK